MSAVLEDPPPDPALTALEAELWATLGTAVHTRGHPWRTATLATVTPAGEPDARTVVLREADPAARLLCFYTDARSPKVAQMQQQPLGLLVLWSAELGWQLRLQVQLTVETSGLAVSSRWARLQMTPAAQDYLSPLPPGSPLTTPAPASRTRVHFAVVEARVLHMDWLDLAAAGHRRAGFGADGAAHWLQP